MLLSLPDGDATRAVAAEIIAASADPERDGLCTMQTVIDLSTIGPGAAVEVAARLADAGIVYCDGPVSGGVSGARAGTLALMFAGPSEAFARHGQLLRSFAANTFAVGSTQAMKLLNNVLSATALAATSEALAFGQAHGLDLANMLDVLNASSGRNSATADKFPNRVLPGSYDSGFAMALMAKDVALFVDKLRGTPVRGPVSEAVEAVWRTANSVMPGADFTEIWTFLNRTDTP